MTIDEKKLVIEIEGKKKSYEIDQIEDKDSFKVKKRIYFVSVITTGYFRDIEIRSQRDDKKEEKKESAVAAIREMMFLGASRQNAMYITVNLEGVGVSIVDEEPKEILFLSIYRIHASMINETKLVDNEVHIIENQEEYNLRISHIQIDNVTSKDNPVLFSPEDGLDKGGALSDINYTPFIQIKLSQTSNKNQKISQQIIDAFQVKIQRMKLEVETGTLKIIVSILA